MHTGLKTPLDSHPKSPTYTGLKTPLNKVTHLNKVMQLLGLDAARSIGDLEEARGVAASVLLTKGQWSGMMNKSGALTTGISVSN